MELPTLTATALSFRRGRGFALQDLSFAAFPGQVLAVLGRNGAGKSTLLSLLSGQFAPGGGEVRVFGLSPRKKAVRRRMVLLPEVSAPPSHLTAEEYLQLQTALWDRRLKKDRCEELLEGFGLAEVKTKRIQHYSKGMRRRLELAGLAAIDPDLWLLDEPQTGLDPDGQRALRTLCQEGTQRGRTILMATHALSDVAALADQILVLQAGRTIFLGNRREALDRLQAAAYVFAPANPNLDAKIQAFAADAEVAVQGPMIPTEALEELIFRPASQAAPERPGGGL